MARATWKGTVIADSPGYEEVEGNVYFPSGSVKREFLKESAAHSECPWKGTASYYDVVVGGETNKDAAWTYAEPKDAAKSIKGYIAFWKGVSVER